MKKYQVVLFQQYLRRFVLNFGRGLKQFEFRHIAKLPKKGIGYHTLPTFEKEIKRQKSNWRTIFRRLLGIPNIRIRFDINADLYFTYGCLVVSFKPYCTYLETGLSLYDYDMEIAKHPLARLIVMVLASLPNCKKLIFLSEAGRRSFFATFDYPEPFRGILEAKSIVIYPVPIAKQNVSPKKFKGTLKLLFPGTFYIKGGMEIAHAYERLRKRYPNLSLTIITATHVLANKDRQYLESLPGLTLHDAKLNEQEMISIYRSHDIFLLPTYRDGFGLVLIEALAYGMPVIITDQYATAEMAQDGYNGFVYPNHPLKDYDPRTYRLFGRYNNIKDFYTDLFALQKADKLKPVEEFLIRSIEKFLNDPKLLEKYSRNSLALYVKKFDSEKLTAQLEKVFLEAVQS